MEETQKIIKCYMGNKKIGNWGNNHRLFMEIDRATPYCSMLKKKKKFQTYISSYNEKISLRRLLFTEIIATIAKICFNWNVSR